MSCVLRLLLFLLAFGSARTGSLLDSLLLMKENDRFMANPPRDHPEKIEEGENRFDPGDLDYLEATFMDFRSDETRLRAHIMSRYIPDIRPVKELSTVTYVNITLANIQVINLDEQNQVIVTSALIVLKWMDEFLKWDPRIFSNQTTLVISPKEIWTPDIVLFNSADISASTLRDNYWLEVSYKGRVKWIFPDILRSYCSLDIKFFPFDIQKCRLEFQSWARGNKEIIVVNDDSSPYMNVSLMHTEWKILNVTVSQAGTHSFVWLEYYLVLERNSDFYVNHMIFPFSILSSLTLFVFWLPPDSGEKITLTITILLALTVFLQLITEYTPKSSKSLPIIGFYFNANLILVLISIILTILVLNFHFRGPKLKRVPKWMRKYIIGYVGHLFCFYTESKTYFFETRDYMKINIPKCDESSKFAKYMCCCDHHVRRGRTQTERGDRKASTPVTNVTTENSGTAPHSLDPSHLFVQLENLIIKLQISFDPLKLKDTHLRHLLLKEIIECENNLLAVSCIKQKALRNEREQSEERKIDMKKLWDEWKIVAMIIDRVCFFLYLFCLLLSSSVFYVSERYRLR